MSIKTEMKTEWNGDIVKVKGHSAMQKSIYEIGYIVEGQAKELCARRYGYLAASINTQFNGGGDELESPSSYAKETPPANHNVESFKKITPPSEDDVVLVGTAVDYACIFGSHTDIKVKDGRGFKTIGQIKKGDMVLTQTGEYHEVVEVFRKPAIQTPDLIEIICEYRKNRIHKLIVTKEHKLLVFREGRNKWVKAEELLLTDTLFSLKKKGTEVERLYRNCIECSKLFYSQTKDESHKFCSQECRIKYWKENGNPNLGSKRTKKTRTKMSLLKKEYFEINPEKHPNRIMNKKGYQTDVEKQIEDWLIDRKVKYEKQKNIGRIYADFYLPKTNEIIEGDGAFWHSNQKKDIERDKYIKEMMPEVKITHMHFYDKRFSKNIKRNPLENVYYQVCNPGVNSYVNMNDFENKKIISIRPFKYGESIKKHGSTQAYVYDLSVDKVHSYYANGILVSNSHVEFGTVKMSAQPFLRPALDLAQGKTLTVVMKNGKYEFGDYLK
jgi:very-short-patch-repair endonuclease/phage gpG-like protein